MSHRGQLNCLNNTVPFHSHTMTPPSSHSPVAKMAAPQRSNSQDSTADSIRKRVCKACDRCRLKKSKCDGSSPCSRCKTDNAICVFGERKKSHDKVYPKGYVEMLEQQQSQLVAGLQEMYRRLRTAGAWSGDDLAEPNGHPLTHDILAALDLLESKHDGSGELETFEEDPTRLQSRLLAEGAAFTHRRGSFSSDSEHSQGHATSASHGTPTFSKPAMFSKDSFDFSAPPTPQPQAHSPAPMPQQQQQQHRHSFPAAHPSPLQQSSPLSNDPQFYQAEWAYPESTNPELLLRSKYAMQPPDLDQGFGNFGDANSFGTWDDAKYDLNMQGGGITSFPQQFNQYRVPDGTPAGMTLEPMMDVEFNQFIQVMT